MLVCVFYIAFCTRDRGCSAHPAFPAPSRGRKFLSRLGRIAPRDRGCVFETAHIVVPANAGTHNHRPVLLRESRRTASPKTTAAAYGSRLKAGTTVSGHVQHASAISRRDASE